LKIKYLIIRFSSIGDIVLTSPVIRCLKNQTEGAEIHFVTKNRFACLVNENPYIDKVHLLTGNLNELIVRLKKENFDYIIDLHHNLRSSRIKSRLKSPAFTFNKLNIEKYLLVNFKINRLPETHIVDRYLETLSVFDMANDGEGLDFFIPEEENFNLNELPALFRNGFIAFVIAGTWATKKLPEHKVTWICNNIDFPVILLGGEAEQEAGESILRQTRGNVLNFAGKVGLYQSASLVRVANLVLTNDTGLMHIAAAFKKKILSFWGSTVPQFGMYPYQAHPASEMLELADLKCRPCSKIGYRRCPKKHFRCMEELDIQKAVQWINRYY